MLAALEKGLVSEEDIRRACVHVMRTRIRLGQLDKTEYDDIPLTAVSTEESKRHSLECALRSAVLLENNGILPLSDKLGTIAVIGPNADSREALTGNYNGTADEYVTFLDGIRERFSGRILYSQGCHLYKDRTQGLAQPGDLYSEALAMAECADVVVACVGLDATLEGEEGDRHLTEYADGSTERGQCLLHRICEKFGFSSLEYQSLDGLLEAIGIDRERICTYCWTGKE